MTDVESLPRAPSASGPVRSVGGQPAPVLLCAALNRSSRVKLPASIALTMSMASSKVAPSSGAASQPIQLANSLLPSIASFNAMVACLHHHLVTCYYLP